MKKIFCLVLMALLLLPLLSSCGQAAEVQEPEDTAPPVEKLAGTADYNRMSIAYTCLDIELSYSDSLVVLGTVVKKGEEAGAIAQDPTSSIPQLRYGWLYHAVYVEVIECYQGNLKPGDVFYYHEFGGETDEYVFTMLNAPYVEVGEEVLLFTRDPEQNTGDILLREEDIVKVTDGMVTPSTLMMPSWHEAQKKAGVDTTMPLEDYVELVKTVIQEHKDNGGPPEDAHIPYWKKPGYEAVPVEDPYAGMDLTEEERLIVDAGEKLPDK